MRRADQEAAMAAMALIIFGPFARGGRGSQGHAGHGRLALRDRGPGERWPRPSPGSWPRPTGRFRPSLYTDYTLRFQTPSGVSGQVIASVQGAASTSLTGAVDQAWIKATFGEGWGIAFGRRVLNGLEERRLLESIGCRQQLPRLGKRDGGQAPGKDAVELFGLLPFTDFNVDINAATVLPADAESPAGLPYYLMPVPYSIPWSSGSRPHSKPAGSPTSERPPGLYARVGSLIRRRPLAPGPAHRLGIRRGPVYGFLVPLLRREGNGRSISANQGWPRASSSRSSTCGRTTASTRAK